MGSSTGMRVLFALALLAIAEAAPINERPIDAAEITEMIVPSIRAAEAPLQEMLSLEKDEVKRMSDIHRIADQQPPAMDFGDEQRAVAVKAGRIQRDTSKAIDDEKVQQTDALKSLELVNGVVDGFHARGITDTPDNSLGEAQLSMPAPIKHALHNLEKVSNILTRDTATSNAKEEIQHMQDQAVEVENVASEQVRGLVNPSALPDNLGESDEPTGAISDLKSFEEVLVKTATSASSKQGAISELSAEAAAEQAKAATSASSKQGAISELSAEAADQSDESVNVEATSQKSQ